MGARGKDAPVTWDWVGLSMHAAILPAYAFHWGSFVALGMGSARYAIAIHLTFILLEGWAIVCDRFVDRVPSPPEAQ